MKIRSSIIWLCAIVAMLLALVVLLVKKPTGGASFSSSETNTLPSNGKPTVQGQSRIDAVARANAPAGRAAVGTSPSNPSGQTKDEQMKQGLAALNDVPIDFYGRLEDQFGNPVAGAQIKGDIRIYNGVQATVQHLTTTSDDRGAFQVHGEHGEALYVVPVKEGYALASTGTEFKYSAMYEQHFSPDPNNPTVVKMWKLQGAEPLVRFDKDLQFRYSGTPVRIDLLTGQLVPDGGDLKITVNRPPGIISGRNRQDWGVQIDAVDGGLIETSMNEARVTYAASDTGYQPSDTQMASSNGHGVELIQQMFFVKSRNGQVYSKVFLSIGINQQPDEPMYVEFRGVANANGSRNWEGDPNTMIKAGQ